MPASDRGYVTAEAATVIPSLLLVAAMLLWGLAAAGAQIRCVDAARAGARAAARAESDSAALAAARSAAPCGAAVTLDHAGDLVRVRVTARVAALTVRGDATALAEEAP
ncbi:MAG: hypothetical protein QOF84_2437 [Streptomyces sp.]|jgi:hypothetical protein|nr:hypothetical protein [Streptomyces sp.]